MSIRIWSKKIVAVLHYYRSNPHTTLFGITGDIDNLGVYVAKNGRAKAEVLVDTYNRVIGSIFYQFLEQQPHIFHESHFIPAGEEVFILGTCADKQTADKLFQHLKNTPIPQLLVTAGLDIDVTTTDISFGCYVLNPVIDIGLISNMFAQIDGSNVVSANHAYLIVMQQIRNILAKQLDLEKFGDISKEELVTILLRNLVYAKTLQHKVSTRKLLIRLGEKIAGNQEFRDQCITILGKEYGLGDKDQQRILADLENI